MSGASPGWLARLSVRGQLAVFGAAVAGTLGMILLANALVLREARDRFDRADAATTVERARTALERGMETDRQRLTESAWWDEVYDYMAHPRAAGAARFLKDNFIGWLPQQYGDQVIGFFRTDRAPQFIWNAPSAADLVRQLPSTALFDLLDAKRSAAGFVTISGRLFAVSGSIILPSTGPADGTPSRGYLVVGRAVTDSTARVVGRTLQQVVSLRPAPPSPDTVLRRTMANGDSVLTRFWSRDLFGRRTVQVELHASRTFLAELESWLQRSLLLAILSGVLLLLALSLTVSRLFLIPIARISQQLGRMRAEGRIGRLSDPAPAREWVLFARSFNHLAEALEAAEAALARARDQALLGTRAKSEFLANMSHEIRTPMNAILGLSDLLRRTALSADQRRYVDAVHGSGEALLTLINDILDLSKIEAGKLSVDTIPFDLHRALRETVAMFTPRAAERGIAMELTIAPGVPIRVLGDPGRLRQVVTNLVGNALKFTQRGSVKVRAREESGSVRLTIEDTGIGIPAEKLDRIFEKFEQAEASTSRKFGGTGLGLAITRELVTLMGGEIAVQSEAGTGSTFSVTLPFAPCVGVPARLPRDVPLRDLKVLQVGREGFARPELTTALRVLGLEVETSPSFVPACDRLLAAAEAGGPFTFVVMEAHTVDLRLEQTITRCRVEALPQVAIIVVLDRGERGAAARLAAAGAHACLVEPVPGDDLREALAVARQVVQARLTWPLITRHWLLEARHVEDDTAAVPDSRAAETRRVLVVDDNELNRLVASEYLRRLGCEVETAESGREAVARIGAGGLDLVFLDCQMPEVDGYETTGMIRALDGDQARIPVVAMTANAMQGDRERCLAAGMDDYVSKPITEADLRRVLGRHGRTGWPLGPVPEAETGGAEVDPVVLEKLVSSGMGGAALAGRLVQTWLTDASAQVAELGNALRAGDRARSVRVAQALRGSAAAIGASGVGKSCHRILAALERDAIMEARAEHARLEQVADRTAPALGAVAAPLSPALDPATLDECRRLDDDMPGLFDELRAVFLRDIPIRLTELEAAVAQGDTKAVRHAAHAIKGAAVQLGALPLSRVASELELQAQSGDLSASREGLERVAHEAGRACDALRRLGAESQTSVA